MIMILLRRKTKNKESREVASRKDHILNIPKYNRFVVYCLLVVLGVMRGEGPSLVGKKAIWSYHLDLVN